MRTRSARSNCSKGERSGGSPRRRRAAFSGGRPSRRNRYSNSALKGAARRRPRTLRDGRKPVPYGGTPGAGRCFQVPCTRAAAGTPAASAPASAPSKMKSAATTSAGKRTSSSRTPSAHARDHTSGAQFGVRRSSHLGVQPKRASSNGCGAGTASAAVVARVARILGRNRSLIGGRPARTFGPASTRTSCPRSTRRAAIGRISDRFPPPSNMANRTRTREACLDLHDVVALRGGRRQCRFASVRNRVASGLRIVVMISTLPRQAG